MRTYLTHSIGIFLIWCGIVSCTKKTSEVVHEPEEKLVEVSSYKGVVEKRKFDHPGGVQSEVYILKLSSQLSFQGDEYVPAGKVNEIQLSGENLNKYEGQEVVCTGDLFGGHTANHIREVILSIKSVRK